MEKKLEAAILTRTNAYVTEADQTSGAANSFTLMSRFVREKPELWDEDIAGRDNV